MEATQSEHVPQVVVSADRVAVTIDRNLYSLEAIYGAAYVFIDRCYVLLDAPEPGRVQVELRGREPLDAEALGRLAGEFGNELLTQAFRQQVAQNNRMILEAVTAKAMAGALGRPDEPAGEPPIEADAFDDPLGIAVPWEEKYGKASD